MVVIESGLSLGETANLIVHLFEVNNHSQFLHGIQTCSCLISFPQGEKY